MRDRTTRPGARLAGATAPASLPASAGPLPAFLAVSPATLMAVPSKAQTACTEVMEEDLRLMGGGIAAADGLSPSFPDECSHQWAQVHSRGHGTDTAGVTIRCELRHGTAHFSKENGPGLEAILRGCLSALRGGRSEEAGPLTSAASMWTIRPWGSRPDSIPFTGHRIRRWSAPFRGGSSRAMNEGTANRNRGTLHTRPLSRSNRTASYASRKEPGGGCG